MYSVTKGAVTFSSTPFSSKIKLFSLLLALNIFFTRAFNDRLSPSSGIIVNTINPGFCVSGLRRTMPDAVVEKVKKDLDAYGYSTEEGSRQLIYGCVGIPQGGEDAMRGAYIDLTNKVSDEGLADWVKDERGLKAHDQIWVSS
jgi:retinol dehydrogenase 12